jgi:hypothetical protein
MPSAALSRLETLLHARKLGMTLSAHAMATPRAVMTSGLEDLDRTLGGGWPAGAISEIAGARSTGRTRVLVSTLAAAAREGHVVALVDAFDRFDPRGAAESGFDLDRLLWVRGAPLTVEIGRPGLIERAIGHAVRAFDLILRAGGFGVVALDLGDAPARAVRSLPAATWLRLAHVNEGRPTVGCSAPMSRSAAAREASRSTSTRMPSGRARVRKAVASRDSRCASTWRRPPSDTRCPRPAARSPWPAAHRPKSAARSLPPAA